MSAQHRARFEEARQRLLALAAHWLLTGGDPLELADEADATASAMRQIIVSLHAEAAKP